MVHSLTTMFVIAFGGLQLMLLGLLLMDGREDTRREQGSGARTGPGGMTRCRSIGVSILKLVRQWGRSGTRL